VYRAADTRLDRTVAIKLLPDHIASDAGRSPTFRESLFSRQYLYMADTESGLNETSFRQRLKRETAAAHQHLEAQLGLLDPSLDVHRYLRVLETFYGFYVPVEIDVTRLAAAEVPLGFPLRARAELIERDLLALGRSPAELAALPLCSDRPELSCFEDLVGCLYVLEGACLGGQVLTPLLHRRLGLAKDSGAAFFAGDEEWTLPRWTVVVAWLDGLPRTGASTAQIIRTAKATFDAFARWAAVARGGLPWPM
jgi:heme oxygenase (biliverdin-IX-beta and delta-forming)